MRWLIFCCGFLFGCTSLSETRTLASSPPPEGFVVERVNAVCSNWRQVMGAAYYPKGAALKNLPGGKAVVQFTVAPDNSPTNVEVVEASDSVFAEAAIELAEKFRCDAGGRKVLVRIPITYKPQ